MESDGVTRKTLYTTTTSYTDAVDEYISHGTGDVATNEIKRIHRHPNHTTSNGSQTCSIEMAQQNQGGTLVYTNRQKFYGDNSKWRLKPGHPNQANEFYGVAPGMRRSYNFSSTLVTASGSPYTIQEIMDEVNEVNTKLKGNIENRIKSEIGSDGRWPATSFGAGTYQDIDFNIMLNIEGDAPDLAGGSGNRAWNMPTQWVTDNPDDAEQINDALSATVTAVRTWVDDAINDSTISERYKIAYWTQAPLSVSGGDRAAIDIANGITDSSAADPTNWTGLWQTANDQVANYNNSLWKNPDLDYYSPKCHIIGQIKSSYSGQVTFPQSGTDENQYSQEAVMRTWQIKGMADELDRLKAAHPSMQAEFMPSLPGLNLGTGGFEYSAAQEIIPQAAHEIMYAYCAADPRIVGIDVFSGVNPTPPSLGHIGSYTEAIGMYQAADKYFGAGVT